MYRLGPRFLIEHSHSLCIGGPGFFMRIANGGQPGSPELTQRAHHVEHHAGLPRLIEVQIVAHPISKRSSGLSAIQGRLDVIADDIFRPTLSSLRHCYAKFAQLFSRLFVSGLEPQCFPQVRHRFIPPPTLRQHASQVAMGLGIISIELHRLAELLERFVRFSKLLQSRGEIIANFGSFDGITLCADRGLIARDGIRPVALMGKSVAKIVLHFGRSGIDRHGLLVIRDRLVHLAVSQKGHAEVIVGVGVTGV